jgi:hypothetical protein
LFEHATLINKNILERNLPSILTCTDADVGKVRICVTETSSNTWPPLGIVVVLVFGGCVPRISPSSSDSGRTVNDGCVSIEIKQADKITG